MPNFPIFMPIVAIVLFLLPIQMTGTKLKVLAFAIWLTGGIVLLCLGGFRLFGTGVSLAMLGLTLFLAATIGLAKGKFVLSKTSQKNIERLDALTETRRPMHVYSVRSWVIIAIMVAISVSLTIFSVSNLVRGGINVAIGLALIVSSLAYLKSLTAPKTTTPQL